MNNNITFHNSYVEAIDELYRILKINKENSFVHSLKYSITLVYEDINPAGEANETIQTFADLKLSNVEYNTFQNFLAINPVEGRIIREWVVQMEIFISKIATDSKPEKFTIRYSEVDSLIYLEKNSI